MMRSPFVELLLTRGHAVVLPESVLRPFLEKGLTRLAVRVRFEGQELFFHAALLALPEGYCITLSKAKQRRLGLGPGDRFEVQLEEDQTEFGVELPPELEEVFRQDPEALELFRRLTPGACRSVIYAVAGFRTPQRRIDLCLLVCERLRRGFRSARELVQGKSDRS